MFDLDDLKKINDKYGHLTGSRAIKRLGTALRSSSRMIDTPARYGGDEFALILPESGEPEAKRAAVRICDQLAHDGQEPSPSPAVDGAPDAPAGCGRRVGDDGPRALDGPCRH